MVLGAGNDVSWKSMSAVISVLLLLTRMVIGQFSLDRIEEHKAKVGKRRIVFPNRGLEPLFPA